MPPVKAHANGLRGDYFLHAHAAGGAQGSYYRRCDTCNHLYDELQGFFLTHNVLMFNVSCFARHPEGWRLLPKGRKNVKAGA